MKRIIITAAATILAVAGLLPVEASAASGAAALTFTNIGSNAYYNLKCTALIPATNNVGVALQFSEDNGSTWKTANYRWSIMYEDDSITSSFFSSITSHGGVSSSTSDSDLLLSNFATNAAPGADIEAELHNLSSSSANKFVMGHSVVTDGTNNINGVTSGRYTGDNGAITAIRVIETTGNITSGQCSLYGYSS